MKFLDSYINKIITFYYIIENDASDFNEALNLMELGFSNEHYAFYLNSDIENNIPTKKLSLNHPSSKIRPKYILGFLDGYV